MGELVAREINPLIKELEPSAPPPISREWRVAAIAAAESLPSCPILCDPMTASHQAPPSPGFSRQEHWSGLPFPSPMHACMLRRFSRVRLCMTPWTAAHQAPLSKGFSRQEYLEWIAISFSREWQEAELITSAQWFNQLCLCNEAFIVNPKWKDSVVVVQLPSCVRLFAVQWIAAHQASLSFTISQSLIKLMSIELAMPSNHLVLCRTLLLPSIFPSLKVFTSESALHIRWPNYWSFCFIISLSNEYSRLISFRVDWFDLLAVQGTLKSLLQHHNSKASILWHSAFFMV